MNKCKAIEFLKQHQPLPDDNDLSSEIIQQYDEIRQFFIQNPDDEVVPLFLRSYGNGDGFGVYPLVEDVLLACSREIVILEIQRVLEDLHISTSVRYWVTQNAEHFVDKRLKKGLLISLEFDNEDVSEIAKMILSHHIYQS